MDGSAHELPQPLQMVKSPRAFNAELYGFEFMVRAPARFTHPMRPSQLSAGVMQQRPAVVILHIVCLRGGRSSAMAATEGAHRQQHAGGAMPKPNHCHEAFNTGRSV